MISISQARKNVNQNSKSVDKLLSYIIAILPIVLQYHAVILTYGLLFLIILFILVCVFNKKLFIDRDFLKLGFVILLQEVISMLVFDTVSSEFINSIAMVEIMCFVVVIGYFIDDKNILYTALKRVMIFCTCVIILQFLLYTFFNINYKALVIIPQAEKYLSVWITNRPASFFTEPQTYCTYIILGVVIALLKGDIKVAYFLLFGMILSGSSSGILIALLIIGYYTLKNKNIKLGYKIFIICFLIIIILLILVLPAFSSYTEKILSIFKDISVYSNADIANSYSYSNYLRIFKSWQTFWEMPLNEKIIGLGINNFSNYLQTTDTIYTWNKIWNNTDKMAGYYTSLGGVFIDVGLIVGIYYYYFLYKKYKKADNLISKAIIILILLHSTYTQIFFNSIFLYYFIYYSAFLENNNNKMEKKFSYE